ncbi:GTP cyclohydrolase II [Paenibacillus sp. NEAU-GSW1]|uniref:GTP cyclohydrolase II n=1 Tax=Paenibacillus sp. NEAU-GSW1 TaxID=2682486 RepID=UPI0012E0FF41|nr:GTP cyclohydrolase II [Paenibacillus sp. NEAU-GSW1]MUT65310.1 GTP cyclohydrolase II RibA [Paenibacillus sp. NEAU-GSW1]
MMEQKVVSILEDKIKHISSNSGEIYLVGPIKLPIHLGEETAIFQWYCWLLCKEDLHDIEGIIHKLSAVNLAEMQQSSVLVYGDFEHADDAFIRMHSICHTGDIFGSKRCDCGFQLHQSLQMIVSHGAGALFYLANHEGRGIGLFSKAMAYLLQEDGYDTVEANLNLGFVDDARNYGDAIRVLRSLREKQVKLITNNPKKLDALRSAGLEVADRIPLWGDVSEYNEKYLQTKVNRSGHLLSGCPEQ